MMIDERMLVFIRSLDRPEDEDLAKLEEKARREEVPIIRPEMKSFLRVLLAIRRPRRILEVGCAVGFSAILMARACPQSEIVTIENYEPRILKAREHFRKFPEGSRITLMEEDAGAALEKLDGSFDFIFMDGPKAQYIGYLPNVLRLLAPGGVLVSDNILQEGDLVESHFAVERRNRTIYKRMREYLYELKHSPVLETSIVPIGDGAAISVRM